MKCLTIYLLFVFILFSCQEKNNYYPEKNTGMKGVIFQKYIGKLDTAYMKGDDYEAGVQLSNMKAPSVKVYEYINKGIEENSVNCFNIYDLYSLYDDFKTNLVKSDTIEFIKSYKFCLELLGKDSYINYQEEKLLAHQARISKRAKLDTTKFDLKLMKELEAIQIADQSLRKKYDLDNLKGQEYDEVWTEIKTIDSVNLVKIEQILHANGYPTKEQVGYDLVTVPWLVLHHQVDLNVRDKYQKMIVQNLSGGLSKTYKWRSNNIRLEQPEIFKP